MKTPTRPPGKSGQKRPSAAKRAVAAPSDPRVAEAGDPVIAASSLEKRIPVVRDEVVPPSAGRSARRRTPQERQRLIARAAYFRSERRGFAPGHEVEDWLSAEREVDENAAAEVAPAGGNERDQ